jgi:hypothetical protein
MKRNPLTIGPKLFHHLTATMVGHLFDWLRGLFMPLLRDALSLRWVLPAQLTSVAYFSTYLGIMSLLVLFSVLDDRRLLERSQFTAERLQHVEAPTGERCIICHDPQPIGPVRLSCQHLFCCGCAHLTFARREDCPLCLRKPLPLNVNTRIFEYSNDIDTRLRKIYGCYLLQLASVVSAKVSAAYMDDAERTPGVQAMISVQQLVFVLLSLALVAVFLLRKAVAWITL